MADVMRYNQPASTLTETGKEHVRVKTRTVSIYPASLMEDEDFIKAAYYGSVARGHWGVRTACTGIWT